MNTGHEGSLTTIHANSPRDAVSRLEQMIAMAGMSIGERGIRQQIASAVTLVLQTQRMSDGKRRVISVMEITGMESDVVQMHELFRFRVTGVDKDGAVQGVFEATGIRPQCLAWMAARGAVLPAEFFNPAQPL
jgi:pilus assembly protein CpaF